MILLLRLCIRAALVVPGYPSPQVFEVPAIWLIFEAASVVVGVQIRWLTNSGSCAPQEWA